ncbi:MAG: diaminohydroxyphosphoribosylaminopyrimidine deaminase [Thermoproteota archaeon]|jgi:diaminohydroxyphosphoribosylaminopyrimidine deaminase/5-amino-6-(5-phosphoribosylamino)uracil reductase
MADRRDADYMGRAINAADASRLITPPNPWVGAAIASGTAVFTGATSQYGGPHAEVNALAEAGDDARGATMYTTLEPCCHHGQTGPCTDAIIQAGITRVVIALTDPDPLVAGKGIERLREAGIEVDVGVGAARVERQLRPYLHHRRTGRPLVVLKLAATLDGFTAAPDRSSKWITGPEARSDSHRLRAESDALLVGAGTIRADDPALTVRDFAPIGIDGDEIQPLRVVLGSAPDDARAQPLIELSGELDEVLADLAGRGVLQLMVEGGAHVAGAFHREGLIDRYVIYLAPALFGGDDARPLFSGPGAPTIGDIWRGEIVDVRQLGADVRIEMRPRSN